MHRYNDQSLLLAMFYGFYCVFSPCFDAHFKNKLQYFDEAKYKTSFKEQMQGDSRAWNFDCDLSKCQNKSIVCHGKHVAAQCVAKDQALSLNSLSEAELAKRNPANAKLMKIIEDNMRRARQG